MKRKSLSIQSLIFTLGLAASLLPGQVLAQQPETDALSPFSIVVKTSDDGFDLTCRQGCAWERLTFPLPADGSAQGVDHRGMTDLIDRQADADEHADFAPFVITISKSDNRVSLMGLDGTAWMTLGFTCPARGCNQIVNERGTYSPRFFF